ncbi:hypothetical protein [Lysobacter gummosus]|uniref:hypothetical protein n=1 Tax=Lysobacter gummosus TaxID=262324 RepID=UPI00362A033D
MRRSGFVHSSFGGDGLKHAPGRKHRNGNDRASSARATPVARACRPSFRRGGRTRWTAATRDCVLHHALARFRRKPRRRGDRETVDSAYRFAPRRSRRASARAAPMHSIIDATNARDDTRTASARE